MNRFAQMIGFVVALLLVTQSAYAVYECGGVQDTCQCGRDNFCICCSNSAYGANHGNCVWYAWHKACWIQAGCRSATIWSMIYTGGGEGTKRPNSSPANGPKT